MAVAVVLLLALGGRGLHLWPAAEDTPPVGGGFVLTDHNGQRVSDADFRGRFLLIYFGYTFCPDVCPVALMAMTEALEALPEDVAERIVPIFITIDPERDTPERLRDYVTMFHPRLVGLTGRRDEIDAVADAYRVYAEVAEPLDEGAPYLMDHTSVIYLMDPAGKLVDHFTHATTADALAQRLQQRVP